MILKKSGKIKLIQKVTMQKNKIFYLLIISLFSLISTISYSQPILGISEQEKFIDLIPENSIIKESFVIKNKGDLDLDINLVITCDCVTIIGDTHYLVNPGKNIIIEYLLDSKELYGNIVKTIIIESNDPQKSLLFYTIYASVDSNKTQQPEVIEQSDSTEGSLELDLYASKNCPTCFKIQNGLIKKISKDLSINIKINFYDLDEVKNYQKFLLIRNNHPEIVNLPIIVIGDSTILSGKKQIYKDLKKELKNIKENNIKIKKNSETNHPAIQNNNLISYLSFFSIVFFGLMDGINPCAFSVIILLVSYLLVRSRSKKEILIAGLTYSAAVFITYFLSGLGMFSLLKSLFLFQWIQMTIMIIMTLGLFLLAGLSIYDYLLIKNKKEQQIVLQLPSILKKQIRQEFRKKIGVGSIIVTPFILGIIVSFLELACTGQIYLPTIIYLLKTGTKPVLSLSYLLLYNLFFILPLIIVFMIIYAGTASDKIKEWFTMNMGKVKLITAIVFLMLAILNLLIYFPISTLVSFFHLSP